MISPQSWAAKGKRHVGYNPIRIRALPDAERIVSAIQRSVQTDTNVLL